MQRLDDPRTNGEFIAELEKLPGVSVHSANGTTLVSIAGLGTRSLRSLLADGTIKLG